MELTQQQLHQLLEYSPATGKLTWRERGREMFKSERDWKRWNNRYAGKQAGGVYRNRYGDSYTHVCVN